MQVVLNVEQLQLAATTYNSTQFKLWFLCNYLCVDSVQQLRKSYAIFAKYGFSRTTIYRYADTIGLANKDKVKSSTSQTNPNT